MVVSRAAKQALPVAVFSAMAYLRFGLPVFVMLSTAAFLVRPLFQYRQWIFFVTSFICLFFGFGVLTHRLLASLKDLYPGEVLSYAAIRPQIFLATLSVIVVGYLMNRRLRNFRLRFLIMTAALVYFSVRWFDEAGFVGLAIFGHCMLFLLIKQGWYLLSETHPGVLSVRYPAVTMFQYWNLTFGTVVPFPVVAAHDVSIDSLERTQWRGVRMFMYTAILHIVYRAVVSSTSSDAMPVQLENYFELYAGPGFESASIIAHRIGGYLGLFVGVVYSGVGVIVFVALTSGYQIAILRTFGYDVPANTTKELLHFTDFNSFLKSTYWYYSYLVSRVVVPRVRSFVKTYGHRLGRTYQFRLTIFGSILVTGLLFHLSKTGLFYSPYNQLFTLRGAIWISLFYILVAGLIVFTFQEKKKSRQRNIGGWRLALRRILILILFFILIVPKSFFSRLAQSPLEIKSYFIGNEH